MRKLIFIAIWIIVKINLVGQDTLTLADVKPYYHEFEILDGILVGSGAEFLHQEFKKHQIIMLGEYHGMKSISEFTSSIIPQLDNEGFKHFGLEVGPTMGKVLDTIPASKTIAELKRLNQKYCKPYDGGMDTPIPFFESVEDAQFLQAANQRGWNIFGVDQEFISSYSLLLDVMFEQLTNTQKVQYRDLHKIAQDSIDQYYNREQNEGLDYTTQIHKSISINAFLNAMSAIESNQGIVDAFRKSIEIYNYNRQRKWSTNYSTRMAYMKQMLKKELDNVQFSFEKDKLLIKMGRLHLSRGVSSYGYSEIGNTLRELAEFNDKTALGIGFETRYAIENDTITDELDIDKPWVQNYYGFKQFGQKHKWVVIDLRKVRYGFYWYPNPLRGKLNASLEKLMENYDILIIPPAYAEPTPNY